MKTVVVIAALGAIIAHAELLNTSPRRYGMAMPQTDWTVDMLDELPEDGQRYELIDGVLFVSPAPTFWHQRVAMVLSKYLDEYLRPYKVARAATGPLDARRPDRRRNTLQPDVLAVRLNDAGEPPPYPFELSDLVLAVEVASPSNREYDYSTKREQYLSHGVAEYWIVNIEERMFTRWRALDDPGEVLTDQITWHPLGMPEPLVIDIPTLFAEALG